MPVQLDSAGSAKKIVASNSTISTLSLNLNVNPLATNVVAFAGVLLATGVNLTDATCGVTFDGVDMEAASDPIFWDSNHQFAKWFKLEDPTSGTVTATVDNFGTEFLVNRYFMLVVATFQNVESMGDPVVATVTTTTDNSVTVPSVLPAHKVISIHACGKNHAFTSETGTRRAYASITGGGRLMLMESPGDESVVATATQDSTPSWAAFGISLAPTPVVGTASPVSMSFIPSASGGTYRTATPDESRYYVIPAIGADDPNQIAGNFVLSSDGVHMPIWVKDPNDIEDYSLDWSNIIPPDDHVIAVRFAPSSSALNVFSTNVGDSLRFGGRENVVTSCWFTGGVASVNYGVVAHITTAEGRQHDRTFRIVGGQK